MSGSHRIGLSLLTAIVVGSCGTNTHAPTAPGDDDESVFCSIPRDDIVPILGADQIPALTDPTFVSPGSPGADYLTTESRVIGVVVDGVALAVPLGILRHHEIVNLSRGLERVSVTYCPLTGSSLTFDRAAVDGDEFGVSGALTRNNLVLFNRTEEPSFFAQMRRQAVCGPLARTRPGLPMVASSEMRWDAWQRLNPGTLVVSRETGHARPYHLNPNTDYERIDNPELLTAIPIDPRRPPKERVFGVPLGLDGGPAFPFEAMRPHEYLALPLTHENRPAVVFWDRSAEGAAAFYSDPDGTPLTFTAVIGGYRDAETGSTWRLDGLATDGPMSGQRLEPLVEAYVSFWFAWADFHPETVIRTAG